MISTSYPHVLADVLNLMTEMADDWEYSGTLGAETYLFGDVGFESLDLVVLATVLQERYGRLPIPELFADIGQRELRDLSIGELVSFVCTHRAPARSGAAR